MNSKLLFATVGLLLASLLAPTVLGCAVFQAVLSTSGCDNGTLYSGIVDNGGTTCSINGQILSDNLFHYACVANFAATFDASSGTLKYTSNHGVFTILSGNPIAGVSNVWASCNFGCSSSDCWVKTSTLEGCAPPPPARRLR